jgi:hypothetical protein
MAVVISELTTELTTDPLTLGYAADVAARDVPALLSKLNDENYTQIEPLALNDLLVWAAKTAGTLIDLIDAAALETNTTAVRSASQAMLEFIRSPHITELDPADPDTMLMINILNTAGIVDKASLVALATVPCSRAEKLWGPGDTVTKQNLWEALA